MIVYLNGNYIDSNQAMISVNDRGFLFGDGLYEMILYYYGRPFKMDRHLARLRHGCEFARLNLENIDFLDDVCSQLIEKNGLATKIASVYVELTRGSSKRAHRFPPIDVPPTIYVAASEFSPNREHQKKGIATITVQDIRWGRCDVKTINLLPNVLAHQKAVDMGAAEALFVRGGNILEGTHSNVFAVREDEVITHPLSEKILPGINRDAVLKICPGLGLRTSERAIAMTELEIVNEMFITSTTLEITPVTKVDHVMIGDGHPGRVTALLQKEFGTLVNKIPHS